MMTIEAARTAVVALIEAAADLQAVATSGFARASLDVESAAHMRQVVSDLAAVHRAIVVIQEGYL